MTLHFENDTQLEEWALRWLQRVRPERFRNAAIDLLLREGYSVLRTEDRQEWLAPEAVRERWAPHLSPAAFWKRLHHPSAPLFALKHRCDRRVSKIFPTPELIAWLSRPKHAGKRHALVSA